jgi:hypothetical protein
MIFMCHVVVLILKNYFVYCLHTTQLNINIFTSYAYFRMIWIQNMLVTCLKHIRSSSHSSTYTYACNYSLDVCGVAIFFLLLHLRRVPSGILQACHPSLTCSILFQQCVMLHCCKILVYFKTFMLRNQLHSSHSWMWKNRTIITSK